MVGTYIQRPVFFIFLSSIQVYKKKKKNHSLHHLARLYSGINFFILCCRVLYYQMPLSAIPPQAVRHLVHTFIGGTSPVFVNPDRLPLTTSTSYKGYLIYRCAVLRSVRCVVLCCVLCCVLWRDGAWDGVVVLASFLFHQQLMRGGGGELWFEKRQALVSGY